MASLHFIPPRRHGDGGDLNHPYFEITWTSSHPQKVTEVTLLFGDPRPPQGPTQSIFRGEQGNVSPQLPPPYKQALGIDNFFFFLTLPEQNKNTLNLGDLIDGRESGQDPEVPLPSST